jgi:hypothetical protein
VSPRERRLSGGRSSPAGRALLLAAAAAVIVLGLRLLALLVPPLDALLAGAPVVVGVLIAVTVAVLIGTVRAARR